MPVDLPTLLDDLRDLVDVESPSLEPASIEASAAAVAALVARRLDTQAELVASDAGSHVHWRGPGEPRVLLVGHHDTVFPLGALAARPFTVVDGRATGPGVFDMKGGIVLGVHAIAALEDRSGIELLVTCDEEVGSGASRALIEERAKACGAVLVLEPAADGGAVKVGRKGTGGFEMVVRGRAAHAGLEPEKGVNALVEAARQVLAISELGRPERGTTVTPTVAHAGTADNVVPAEARVRVDVRVTELAEADRVQAAMAALTPVDPAASLDVHGGLNRPPMPESATAELFALARNVAVGIGVPVLAGIAVGGGSDGNFTAALGIPTLDGLGVSGGGAHADHEWADTTTMVERTRLLSALIAAIRSGP
jgi:glutamate carboxypeptidase